MTSKKPRTDLADLMAAEVRRRWQPQIRARARKAAATTEGLMIDVRARFGFTAAPGTTDDARMRHLTLALPPHHAARLLDAAEQGATDRPLQQATADALGEVKLEKWEAAEKTNWGVPVDTHPQLCDGCKHQAVAATQETNGQEPLPDWAKEYRDFLRYPRRPRCTECKAAFTDERWQAVERTGWGTVSPEARPTLCGACVQQEREGIERSFDEQDWTVRSQRLEPEQALPEQKAGGTWLSRFRR